MNVLEDKLKQKDIQQFRDDLISWFERERRILPWREDQDPYKVWVSEVMLAANESRDSDSLLSAVCGTIPDSRSAR